MLTVAQFYALANVTLKFWAFGLKYTIRRFRHIGIDIGTGRQAIDVPALLGGTVVAVVRTGSMGMVVVLKVGDRYHAYCHLANVDLPDEGDVIKQGQRVGQLAWSKDPKSLGYAGSAWTGIHLHLVVSNRADGAYRYPAAKDALFYDPAPIIADVLRALLAPKPVVKPKPAPAGKPSTPKTSVVIVDDVNGLNLRKKATTASPRVLLLQYGAKLTVTGAAKGTWLPVRYGKAKGWVHRDFVTPAAVTSYTPKGTLTLRLNPSTTSRKLAAIPHGTRLTILSLRGAWRRVAYAGKTGWVSGKCIR